MDSEKPPSPFQRFLSSPKPGLPFIALAYCALLAFWAYLYSLPAWVQPLQTIHPDRSYNLYWLLIWILLALWPLSTLVTHLLARAFGWRAPFLRALHTTGKAWILHALALLAFDAVLAALGSLGWQSIGEICYISLRGGIIWLIYPSAIQAIYGEESRSCLLTILTAIAILLLTIGAGSLAYWLLSQGI
ncbi:MAG: hypothetical protein AB1894_18330 [Chloroflexota bacterium]